MGQIFSKRSLLIVRGFVCERTDSSLATPISITCDVRANFFIPLLLFPSSLYVCSSESKIFSWNWYRRSGRKLHFVWPGGSPTCYLASWIYRRLRRICGRSSSKNLSGTRDRFRDLFSKFIVHDASLRCGGLQFDLFVCISDRVRISLNDLSKRT